MDLFTQLEEATRVIRERTPAVLDAGLILGSGLGALADAVEDAVTIPYGQIPHFPESTVAGHSGELVIGKLSGHTVACMKGRIHYYEGYTMQQVTFPVRLLQSLGARMLLVTNSCGGLAPRFRPGDLMLITDHLNLMGTNPLIGRNDERLGVRFPAMSYAYDVKLGELARECARELGIELKQGVYCGLTGPTFETPAEIRYLQNAGADAVGMSTVPEVIVARHGEMQVLGLSCVTNILHEGPSEDSHHDVLAVAARTSPSFMGLIKTIMTRWGT